MKLKADVKLNVAKMMISLFDRVEKENLITGGHWFDHQFGQYFFWGLMIVIATGFIPLSPLSIVSTMVIWEKKPVAWKEYCMEYRLKELQESMDKCTGRCNITEKLLKMVLYTLQSINQSISTLWFLFDPYMQWLNFVEGVHGHCTPKPQILIYNAGA